MVAKTQNHELHGPLDQGSLLISSDVSLRKVSFQIPRSGTTAERQMLHDLLHAPSISLVIGMELRGRVAESINLAGDSIHQGPQYYVHKYMPILKKRENGEPSVG